jgi:hypothetical protein
MMAPTMTIQEVTLPVRPGDTVRFPPLCVACGQPAAESLTIRRRQGQTLYRLDVPVCADCLRLSRRRSGRQETLLRAGWLAAVVGAVLAFGLVWLISGSLGTWLRLGAALIGAAVAAGLAYASFRRAAGAAELPEARAVREAAQIRSFTWGEVTLLLSETLADRVAALNGATSAAGEPEASPPVEVKLEQRD